MVSVVIPTYGRPGKISDAIECTLRQTYYDLEIIIVDDNGKGTQNQIETQKTVKNYKDNRLRYLIHEKNMGGCAARNTGIRNSEGKYIAFLDDDDIWAKTYIEKMITLFRTSDIGAVYCDYFISDGFYTWGIVNRVFYEGNVYRKLLRGWCPTSTSLVVVRRKAIIDAGYFDEKLKSFQDYDMWLRLSQKYNFKYCNEKLIIKYENVGEQVSVNPYKRLDGFKCVCKKWDKELNDSEMADFSFFKTLYTEGMNYNRIIYFVTKNKKYYRHEIWDYLRSRTSIINKIKIIKKMVIPASIGRKIIVLKLKINPNGLIYKGMPEGFS